MTALQNRKVALGRHPLLRTGSLAHRIFNFLKTSEDGCTIQQIASHEREIPQSVNGMLQRMKRHGLVTTQPINKGNRVVTGYFAVTENESGHARDELAIEVLVMVNDYGEYSAVAQVVGESPLAHEGNPKSWHKHTFTMAVPKPGEPTRTRTILDGGLQVIHVNKDLVIEGEIVDIKDK